eukprot:1152236-Pelagomonas_calceolata.AAC.1
MATYVAGLLLGGLKLVLGPGVFTVFDLHKMDVPLFWKELTRVAGLGSRWDYLYCSYPGSVLKTRDWPTNVYQICT